MLLLSLILLAGQQTAAAPLPDEVVVIGRRLARWTGKYSIRGTRIKCATRTSTGDRAIDAIGCQAFEACADALEPRIAASDAASLDKTVRLSMKAEIKRDLSQCVAAKRVTLIAGLAGQRRTTR